MVQAVREADRGPAKNQMIKPMTGNISTSNVQITFAPVVALELKIEMMAQIFRARTITPPIPAYSIIISSVNVKLLSG
jgi:hypothetical protein